MIIVNWSLLKAVEVGEAYALVAFGATIESGFESRESREGSRIRFD